MKPYASYSPELFEEICQRIAGSDKGLRALLGSEERFPTPDTFLKWVNLAGNAERYAHAKRQQMDLIAEDILDISNNSELDANDKRVRIDARRWLLSKLIPKTYGDRIDVTSGGEKLPAPTHQIDARVQSIVMQAAARMAKGEPLVELDEEAQRLLE